MFSWGSEKKVSGQPKNSLTVVLVGDYAVGKTALFERILDNKFNYEGTTTIGVDFRVFRAKVGETECKLRLWDTAGMERFRSLISCYFAGAQVMFMVCDCTDIGSVKNLAKVWYPYMKKSSSYKDNTLLYILVNKWDQRRKINMVPPNENTRKDYVRRNLGLSIPYRKVFFVSARNGEGVFEMIGEVVKDALGVLKKRKANAPVSFLIAEPEKNSDSDEGDCCWDQCVVT
jgi:small GTP-binding protein